MRFLSMNQVIYTRARRLWEQNVGTDFYILQQMLDTRGEKRRVERTW